MILLRPSGQDTPRLVAVFGVGLIGSSLVAALEKQGARRQASYPISWNQPTDRAGQFSLCETAIGNSIADGECTSLEIVWSAGRCGFEASQEQADAEREGFDEGVTSLERVARESPGCKVRLTLISTAGGLFEGQRHVDRHSRPSPNRPYGRLKLYQEERILAGGVPWTPAIVRLTSVVGPVGAGRRQGLVSTLVANGLRRTPTRIVGRMETLRDFISVDDVAAFLARRICRRPDSDDPDDFDDFDNHVMTLASYKPSSLGEVQRLVERILGRRLYVHYALSPSNEMDITFSPNLRPLDWAPRDLFASVRDIYQGALTRGTLG